MSDFIKVNFEQGNFIVARRNEIELRYDCESETHFALTKNILLSLQCRFFEGAMYNDNLGSRHHSRLSAESIMDSHYFNTEITREEYDRLCKELGVES